VAVTEFGARGRGGVLVKGGLIIRWPYVIAARLHPWLTPQK
jgi:hypothetical protein